MHALMLILLPLHAGARRDVKAEVVTQLDAYSEVA